MTLRQTAADAGSLSIIGPGLLLTAAAAEPAAPPTRPLEIRYVAGSSTPAGGGFWELRFTLRNPTRATVSYSGYAPDAPAGAPLPTIAPRYRLELQQKKSWTIYNIGWCGTGKQALVIGAGQTVAFQVHVPPGDWEAVRVGLSWCVGFVFSG